MCLCREPLVFTVVSFSCVDYSMKELVPASRGHSQASATSLTFSQRLCEIFMTALIYCVALAVAGGGRVNAVSIQHANATHLTNRASMQTTTPPIPEIFVLLTANRCSALSTGGQGEEPAVLKVKQLSGLSASTGRENAWVAYCE